METNNIDRVAFEYLKETKEYKDIQKRRKNVAMLRWLILPLAAIAFIYFAKKEHSVAYIVIGIVVIAVIAVANYFYSMAVKKNCEANEVVVGTIDKIIPKVKGSTESTSDRAVVEVEFVVICHSEEKPYLCAPTEGNIMCKQNEIRKLKKECLFDDGNFIEKKCKLHVGERVVIFSFGDRKPLAQFAMKKYYAVPYNS